MNSQHMGVCCHGWYIGWGLLPSAFEAQGARCFIYSRPLIPLLDIVNLCFFMEYSVVIMILELSACFSLNFQITKIRIVADEQIVAQIQVLAGCNYLRATVHGPYEIAHLLYQNPHLDSCMGLTQIRICMPFHISYASACNILLSDSPCWLGANMWT